MITIPSAKKNLERHFSHLAGLYDAGAKPGFEAVYQFVLKKEAEEYSFYLSIRDGRADYREGVHSDPDVTICAPVGVWFDVVNGRLNALWGLLTGKYRIRGSLYCFFMLKKILGRGVPPPAPAGYARDIETSDRHTWKKPENILVINGSARRKEGTTYLCLNSLIKGIEKAGSEVEVIDVYDPGLDIQPCSGCLHCWTYENGKCIIKDDAAALIEKIKNAYLTVYALPLYSCSIPSRLKALIDRTRIILKPAFEEYSGLTRPLLWDQKEQYIALLAVNGLPEIEHLKPLVAVFEGIARNSHRPLIATILRPGADLYVHAPIFHEHLAKILDSLEKAGKELAEKGRVSRNILRTISSDFGVSGKRKRDVINAYWALRTRRKDN